MHRVPSYPTFPSENCIELCSKSCRMRSAVDPQDIISTCMYRKPFTPLQNPQIIMKNNFPTPSSPSHKNEYNSALQKSTIVTAYSHPVSAPEYAPRDADSPAPCPSPGSPSRPHGPPSSSPRPAGGSWRRRRPSSASRYFARRGSGRGSGGFPLRCRSRRLLLPLDFCFFGGMFVGSGFVWMDGWIGGELGSVRTD